MNATEAAFSAVWVSYSFPPQTFQIKCLRVEPNHSALKSEIESVNSYELMKGFKKLENPWVRDCFSNIKKTKCKCQACCGIVILSSILQKP